jgi:hypothetical protein
MLMTAERPDSHDPLAGRESTASGDDSWVPERFQSINVKLS